MSWICAFLAFEPNPVQTSLKQTGGQTRCFSEERYVFDVLAAPGPPIEPAGRLHKEWDNYLETNPSTGRFPAHHVVSGRLLGLKVSRLGT